MIKKIKTEQKKKLLTLSFFSILIISIIAIASSVFFQTSNGDLSEMSLLTYNSSSQIFEADRYPDTLEAGENETIFFMVKNFENIVKYYQVQIKATKISQYITYEYPLNSTNSYTLYKNDTYEKILSPATTSEKKDSKTFSGDYIWGPVNVTIYSNSLLEAVLEGEEYVKIAFELWEFDTISSSFIYSGIFTLLELLYIY